MKFYGSVYLSCLSCLVCVFFTCNAEFASADDKYAIISAEDYTYIIHMDTSLMPKVFTSHHQWYSFMIDYIKFKSANPLPSDPPTPVYTYHNAFHGFSCFLSREQLETLMKFSGVISAYKDQLVTLDTTHTPEFLSLSPSVGLWSTSANGENIIIGFIDTGVWPESKSFKDNNNMSTSTGIPARWKGLCEEGEYFQSSMCNNKLIGAKYFNKGLLTLRPDIKDVRSARDILWHGTQTSSIAAGNFVESVSYFGYANGTAKRIAPHAKVAMYKVCWEVGGYASDVVAGIDQAIADGVDIISISMGFGRVPLFEDPVAIASFGAVQKGILVSCSAINGGAIPGSLHNGIPWVITTATGSVDRWFSGNLTLGNEETFLGWTVFPATTLGPKLENLLLLYNKTLSACDYSLLSLHENAYYNFSIIICDKNNTIFSQILNSDLRAIFIYDYPLHEVEVTGAVISSKDASKVFHYATTSQNPIASITFGQTFTGWKPAPTVSVSSAKSPFSSFPSILKPDVMAPGSLVLASWIPDLRAAQTGRSTFAYNDFNMLYGTSAACSHTSGVAALLKSSHLEWSPAAIRSALVTTANPLDNSLNPIQNGDRDVQFASPLDMGAGQIDPNGALEPGLVYDANPQD